MVTDMFKLARPKLQGVPCRIINGEVNGDFIKNKMVREILSGIPQFVGELVVGKPESPTCYEDTIDAVGQAGGFPLFVFWVYDMRTTENYGLCRRLNIADSMMNAVGINVQFVDHELIETKKQLEAYHQKVMVEQKFPGIVLRDVEGTYGTWDEETTTDSWPQFRTVHRHDPRRAGTYKRANGALRRALRGGS